MAKIAESVPGVIRSFRMGPDGSISMPLATQRVQELYGIPASRLAKDFQSFIPMCIRPTLRPCAKALITHSDAPTPGIASFAICIPKRASWIEGGPAQKWSPMEAFSGMDS